MSPMIKSNSKGLLHVHLGIPKGQKIPLQALMQAKRLGMPKVKKEANFAVNFAH